MILMINYKSLQIVDANLEKIESNDNTLIFVLFGASYFMISQVITILTGHS